MCSYIVEKTTLVGSAKGRKGWMRIDTANVYFDHPYYSTLDHVLAIDFTNEGEGAAICGGIFLSGKRAALVMENSGLRASIEPLARMGLGAGIPVVMLMSYRGELGENNWWAIPHGITMEPVLDALRIPYQVVREEDKIERAITDAYAWSYASYYHSAVALGGEVVR